jgi:uncharacterized protein (DUF433 family)
MGWGEAHQPVPPSGTTAQMAAAMAALRDAGITAPNLALAALDAAKTLSDAARVTVERPVLTIDLRRQFGRVCVAGTRITAETIGGMVAAGDTVDQLVDAYSITRDDVLLCAWWYGIDCLGSRRKWERKVAAAAAWEDWLIEAEFVMGRHKAGPLGDPPEVEPT